MFNACYPGPYIAFDLTWLVVADKYLQEKEVLLARIDVVDASSSWFSQVDLS
jgi:hypothetical protein